VVCTRGVHHPTANPRPPVSHHWRWGRLLLSWTEGGAEEAGVLDTPLGEEVFLVGGHGFEEGTIDGVKARIKKGCVVERE
jgi:hypothetical protein